MGGADAAPKKSSSAARGGGGKGGSKDKGPRKRNPFTTEEVDALKEGLRLYKNATNHWAHILQKYQHVFHSKFIQGGLPRRL